MCLFLLKNGGDERRTNCAPIHSSKCVQYLLSDNANYNKRSVRNLGRLEENCIIKVHVTAIPTELPMDLSFISNLYFHCRKKTTFLFLYFNICLESGKVSHEDVVSDGQGQRAHGYVQSSRVARLVRRDTAIWTGLSVLF